MAGKPQQINERQTESVLIRCFLQGENRKQIDQRIVTDVKTILASVERKGDEDNS